MIFGNGCWLQKEGCGCHSPQEVYFETITDTSVRLVLPTNRINHKGDTLGGINLTMIITSPAPEVLRVQTYHHMGALKKSPEFELEQKEELPLTVTTNEDILTIQSGTLTLEINKKYWSMTYKRNGEVITKSAAKDLACMKMDWKGNCYDKGDIVDTYMRQQLSMGVGELIYGLGERFTAFAKNGQSVQIWNEDGGTSTYQSYKNIPFYISNKGYGVFVNHPEKVEFEVATEQVTKTAFSVEGGYLDYYLFNGPTMKEVLSRYTDLTGKPSLPAPWTFGLWLSTSFTTSYDEETVMSFVNGMLDRDIPLRTFHFDCCWMRDFHWTDFVWDSKIFPDPEGMLKRIKDKGLNICVWINPYIAQESILFEEGMANGYLVKRTNGDVWQWDMWQPGMALVDFTNPAACEWFQKKLEGLLDIGVDCFKTDFGERIPVEDICYFDGSDPKKMHNFYTHLYNKCVYEILQKNDISAPQVVDNITLWADNHTDPGVQPSGEVVMYRNGKFETIKTSSSTESSYAVLCSNGVIVTQVSNVVTTQQSDKSGAKFTIYANGRSEEITVSEYQYPSVPQIAYVDGKLMITVYDDEQTKTIIKEVGKR